MGILLKGADGVDEGFIQKFKSGHRYTQLGHRASSIIAQTANGDLGLAPFPVPNATTFDRVSIYVVTAGSTGALVRAAIYRDNGEGYPGGLVSDFGTWDATVISPVEKTINLSLSAGMYWMGGGFQGSPVTRPVVKSVAVGANIAVGVPQVGADTLANTTNVGQVVFVTGYPDAPPDPYPIGGTLPVSFATSVHLRAV